jgi:hypothetical protein
MATPKSSKRKNPFFDPAAARPMTKLEAAWLAGLLEGEGCIRLQVHDIRDWKTGKVSKDRVTMSVTLAMKDETAVSRVCELTGGHYHQRGDGLITLTISSRRALWVLEQVERYMVGDKKAQAQIAIDFQKQRNHGHRNTVQHAAEIDAARRISELKKIGIYPARKGPRAVRLEAAIERYTPQSAIPRPA